MKDTSPYAELAQRNSVLSAGLRKSKHSLHSPARPTFTSEGDHSDVSSKTRSTVATETDYPALRSLVSPSFSRASLRGRSRSSSCEGPGSPEGRKGKGRALPVRCDQEADLHFTRPHEVFASPGSSRLGCGSSRHCDGPATATFWTSLFTSEDQEAAVPSTANQVDPSSRGTSPVPAVQCGTPEGNSVSPPPQERSERLSSATMAGLKKSDLMKEQLENLDAISEKLFMSYPLLGGLERLSAEEPTKPQRTPQRTNRKSKGRSSDSRTEENSTHIPSDASETSSSHSRGTSFSLLSPRKTKGGGGLASGLSENNPLLGGLEWDNKPDDAQLELLDRMLGATAAHPQEVGPPLLPANFLGRQSGTSLHTSLSAVEQPSSCSPQRKRRGSLESFHGPMLTPSSVVQVISSKTGRVEQATILLVDLVKGTYKIRTLDGHTETVKAHCVSPLAPGTS